MHKQQQRSKAQESTARIAQSAEKLIGGIFSTMSVAHADDDEDDCCSSSSTTTSACRADRLLSNGDFYTGEWADGTPHGTGKYLWTDGCMYEGEWASGEITGHGKFSWPSGATYEGQFSSGFMHGLGTYTGPAGDTYRGSWALNSKHGEGRKNYANGDCYEGEWRCGSQDGRGRYVWKNGNEYEGEWKNGGICGKGSMLWANGNRYVGSWEDGLPKGEGRFMWADGSFHVGNWSMYQNEQSGTYYPSVGSSAFGMLDREPHEVFSIDLDTVTVCPVEKVSILPSEKTLSCDRMWLRTRTNDNCKNACRLPEKGFDRICIWETNGDITCDIVVGSSVAEQDGKDEFIDLRVDNGGNSRRPPTWQVKEIKKQGETISKGHKNYELMLSLQLGIRYSVGKPAPATSLDLKLSAFNPKEKAWTKFPPEGTKYTPPHQTSEFKWKDYCPLVFRTLRKVFKIDAADYMISICGNDVLRELSSPGKSGSLFYLTHDDHFMIKTLKKSEVKVLLRMLPAYYNHVRAFENTLVTKFFGLHCVKLSGTAQKKVFFVIMGNLCCSEYAIHRRFDLKGSSHGRVTVKPEAEIDENTTLKDLDLNCIFRLPKAWFEELHRQLDRDCDFLEQERIMDYSLLVGMHFREASFSLDSSTIEGNCKLEQASGASPRLSSVDMHQILFEPTRWATIRLGENMPARIEQTIRRSNCDSQMIGQPTGKFCDALLFFGIIDILQDYDISKKLEHAYKSIHYDPTSISAVDPKQYSKRFHDFIYKVFVEDT